MTDWPRQSDCDSFYGNPRGKWGSQPNLAWQNKNIVYIVPPYPMHMGSIQIKKIAIHKKCSDSLLRVLNKILSLYKENCGDDALDAMNKDGVRSYDGSFVYRPMRGGSHLSMHAYGCAIDIDAQHNPFHSHNYRFNENSIIVQCFKEEDWTWGGDWHNPDAMHFQAAYVG